MTKVSHERIDKQMGVESSQERNVIRIRWLLCECNYDGALWTTDLNGIEPYGIEPYGTSLMGRALWDEPYETNLLETSLMEMAYIKNDNVSDNVFSEKIIVSVCLGWSMSRAQGISKSLQ